MNEIQHNLFAPTRCNPCLLPPAKETDGPRENNSNGDKPEEQTKLQTNTDEDKLVEESKNPEIQTTEDKTKPSKLLKCLGCKLILYCSPEHQQLDWPIHRKFCRAVSQLLTKYKINNIFAMSGPIITKSDLTEAKIKVKSQLATILKRKLHHHEEELTSFPVMCEVCFSTKFNQLTHCKECNAVSYCCPEHEEKDTPNHQEKCLKLKLYYSKFKIDPSYQLDSLQVKEKSELAYLNLTNLMSQMFGIELVANPSEELVEYQKFSFVSDFSCIASVVYLVEIMRKTRELREDFTLYIVGATNDYIWFDSIHAEFFFACFPHVTELNIIFIGPELEDKRALAEPYSVSIETSEGRTFCKTLFHGTYEEYFEERKTYPDMIACFNCGFSENADKESNRPADSWYYGIWKLIEVPVPILFTSYTREEAINDLEALEYVLEERWKLLFSFEKMIWVAENPYKDLRPLRNWHSSDAESIFYRNGWIQAVRVYHNF